jgi:5-methylcytosine-specific restriction endonuclease McrA
VDQFDVAEAEPERVEISGSAFKRDPSVRAAALRRANGRCEYCGEDGFKMPNGGVYLETHHVVPLCEGGADNVRNVAALCPNDHKRAHFSIDRGTMRKELIERIRN